MRLRGALLLAVTASVGAVLVLAGPASAANLHCGQNLNTSVTLIGNLDCSAYPHTAIVISGNHVTLNLNGYSITADPAAPGHDAIRNFVCATLPCTPAVGTTIKGGTLNIGGDDIGINNAYGGGNSLTVAGVTIVGDGSHNDSAGIVSEESSGLSVTGGSISGVKNGVWLEYETGDLVKGNKITPLNYDTHRCAGVYEEYGTADMVISNTFTSAKTDQSCYGLYSYESAGSQFSGNTATAMLVGVKSDEYDAGLTITGNVMDGNVAGIDLNDYDSGDMIAGNYIKNSVEEGILDFDSFNNTYNGNVLTSNGTTSNGASYVIVPDGYGFVTMVNNYARTGNGFGFLVADAYNDSVPGGPYSLFTGNVATANGSDEDPGFLDFYSVGATWSKNVANYNNGDGFGFCDPWRETVMGNSANLNGGDGYYFGYDCVLPLALAGVQPAVGTIEDEQPLAVTNNSATNNGELGFDADFPIAGSGNTGKSTNVEGDCYLVAGCS